LTRRLWSSVRGDLRSASLGANADCSASITGARGVEYSSVSPVSVVRVGWAVLERSHRSAVCAPAGIVVMRAFRRDGCVERPGSNSQRRLAPTEGRRRAQATN